MYIDHTISIQEGEIFGDTPLQLQICLQLEYDKVTSKYANRTPQNYFIFDGNSNGALYVTILEIFEVELTLTKTFIMGQSQM